METPELVARLEDYFSRNREGLAAVYLFGSHARSDAREGSDVDLGLLYQEAPPPSVSGPSARMEDDLEALLGRRVQAVVMNSAPPDLVHRVLRDGRLLREDDRSGRIRFEVAARREYFDLLPFLRRYRRAAGVGGSGPPPTRASDGVES